MPIRVLGRGGGTLYDVLQGVRYAAGLDNDSGRLPERPAEIINLSLASPVYDQVSALLFRELHAAGVIVVAASGNNGSTSCVYPACYDGVLSVSAVGPDGELAHYSNTGRAVDLAAPGGDQRRRYTDGVLSTLSPAAGSAYGYLQGTSMATAHASGVMALMKAVSDTECCRRRSTIDDGRAHGGGRRARPR